MAPARRRREVRREDRTERQTVELDLGGHGLAVTVLGDRLLRFRWSPTGAFRERRPWAVTAPEEGFDPVDFEVVELDRIRPVDGEGFPAAGGRGWELRTRDVAVTIAADGWLAVATREGRDVVRAVGRPSFDPVEGMTRWPLAMPPDRRYYGFGERTGDLEKRGRRYTCWTTDEWRHQGPVTDALYVAVPFHLALDADGVAHGIFLDTTYRSAFDLGRVDRCELVMEAETAGLDWYLIYGPEPGAVVEAFTALVGRPSLPPRWALGYHQARWSYGTADEALDVGRQLRAHRIPADVVHLDIDHMDRYRPFTWGRRQFPDPPRLVAELERLGLRTTVVVDAPLPIADGYEPYETGRERGMFVRRSREPGAELVTGWLWGGQSAYPDQLRPEVREWWGRLHTAYLEDGIAGFVNDMNEPAMHDRPIDAPDSLNAEPPPGTPFGDPEQNATHAEVRNMYGQLMNEATATFLRRARPAARPFVASRAGFAGVQRDAITWTGDNWSVWEHLEMSLPQLLNLGLSGIPFAGADIGGFFDSCPPELLVRWTQLGAALYPFARNNSARDTARQEPWVWGEPTTSRCRRAIELRYRLLPYLYTAVEGATRTGLPVLRPLFLEHPDDPGSQLIGDQALLGRELLVAPVLRPGRSTREVYLPPGDWFDTRGGPALRRIRGGRTVILKAGLDDDIPLLARAGSIVPMAPVVQSTRERPDRLEVHVYPSRGGSARGELYEDDGESMAYLDGAVGRTSFRARRSARGTVVGAERVGPFDPGPRTVEVHVHGRPRPARADVEDASSWEVTVS